MGFNFSWEVITLFLAGFGFLLVLLLALSFALRPFLFCQYLKHMAGFDLKPKDVKLAFKRSKQQGVRDLFLELYAKADLEQNQEELQKLQEEVEGS